LSNLWCEKAFNKEVGMTVAYGHYGEK